MPGTVVAQSQPDDDVRVRTYDAAGKRFVSVAYRGATQRTIEVTIPGSGEVTDLVTGDAVQAKTNAGTTRFSVTLSPMSLNSYSLAP
ncbi:MAG: hypothetical protein QM760_15070 [Nibricoccus sp.]